MAQARLMVRFSYSKAVNVGKGNYPFFVPRMDDAVDLTFFGYVTYPAPTGWLNTDPAFYDEDAIRLFRTHILSDRDQLLPIAVGIDDGHSIQPLVKVRGAEEDLFEALLDLLGAEGLAAHRGVGVEGVDDGVDERILQVG